MRIKVICNSDPELNVFECTKVVDAATGEPIPDIRLVEFRHVGGELPSLTVEFLDFEAEIEAGAVVAESAAGPAPDGTPGLGSSFAHFRKP